MTEKKSSIHPILKLTLFVVILSVILLGGNLGSFDPLAMLLASLPYLLAAVIGGCIAMSLVAFSLKYFGKSVDPEDIKQNNLAIEDLNAGRIGEATQKFEKLLDKLHHSDAAAVAALNLGDCYLRNGVLEAAMRRYEQAIDEHPIFKKDNAADYDIFGLAAIQLARGYALSNQLDKAREWFKKAKSCKHPLSKGALAIPQLLLNLKNNDWRQCAETAETDWFEIEAVQLGHNCRLARILRAFALIHLSKSEERADQISMLIVGVKPHLPGEFDYLGNQWPEMEEFLVTQGLKEAAKAIRPGG